MGLFLADFKILFACLKNGKHIPAQQRQCLRPVAFVAEIVRDVLQQTFARLYADIRREQNLLEVVHHRALHLAFEHPADLRQESLRSRRFEPFVEAARCVDGFDRRRRCALRFFCLVRHILGRVCFLVRRVRNRPFFGNGQSRRRVVAQIFTQ